MPIKAVQEYQCERCNRTWYEASERQVASLAIKVVTSDGVEIVGQYDVLCKTCESAVTRSAQSLVKKVEKKGPKKSGAKEEEEAEASSSGEEVTDDQLTAADEESEPEAEEPRARPRVDWPRQSM